MKINVKRIPAEGEDLHGADPATIIDVDNPDVHFKEDVRYDLHAQLQGNALLVTGRLATAATLRCSRCLRTFPQPLLVREFVFHEELKGDDFVDLTAQMREDIILELPQRALCDSACKGLCPRCGADWNQGACRCPKKREDGHWHALDQLKLQ
jgi:uncharacterized protein